VLTTCQPSTVWCSRERLPAAAAQPAKDYVAQVSFLPQKLPEAQLSRSEAAGITDRRLSIC
jgi:hypothetical protein